MDRYSRQIRFAPLGEAGQQRLAASKALVVGCGALGTAIANTLVRSGVGHVRIVDRDFVELSNLQRQTLFDEDDVAAVLPKAIAAAHKLRRVNSQVTVEPIVADIDASNIREFCRDMQVLVDGSDNFEIRFLVNDAAHALGIPWVYGGCLGAEGQTMTILPGETACLRCLMSDMPPPGSSPTCDTAGILGPIIGVIAALEAAEALKILSGHREAVNRGLTIIDAWENRCRQVKLDSLRAAGDCPACHRQEYPWLNGQRGSQTAVLCGRNAVQLSFPARERIDLTLLAEKLAPVGRVERNPFLLRLHVPDYVLTVFPDGRTIISGTDDVAAARGVHARYIGA